ncbi:MAG: prolyl oligopeptidase family serine peptidase [Acidobacteriota bacterium]
MRRFALSLAFLLACSAFASAQDAGQALRISVGYNTQYNTVKNSPAFSAEKRAEVERLGKLAQEASAARRYGDAIKHYLHAMTLMRGAEWTPTRALSSALTLKLDRAIAEPAQTIRLHLGQMFSTDEKIGSKLTATVDLNRLQGNETIKTLKTVDAIEPDFIAHPAAIEVTAPDVEAGNYRINVTLKYAGATEAITKAATVHIERGIASRFAEAKERAARLEARLKEAKKDSLLAALPSAQYRIRLFDMAAASEINFDRINFNNELKEATTLLDEIESGRDPFALRRGDLRKAYLSKVDDTYQPYRIYVPTYYDGSKPFPLIIALHGMGGDENSYFDQYLQGAFKVEAEKRGYIVACPKGRQPASMYLGAAERDVVDVIEDVRRGYRIDADRIYMTGHSMGGYGTWSVAMNHPQIFAALAPVAGGGNPAGMSRIAHIPQMVVHGDDDKTVPVERSRVMVEAAKKLGVEMKYMEIAGGDHVSVAARTFKEVYDFFDTHRRKSADKAAAASKQK